MNTNTTPRRSAPRPRRLRDAALLAIGSLLGAGLTVGLASPAAASTILFSEDFTGLPNGTLPTGWSVTEGSWQVTDGELVGSSPSSSDNSRIAFTASPADYRLEMSMRFVNSLSNARWAGAMLDTAGSGLLWTMAGIRYASTASNGVEITERRSGWITLEAGPAPTNASAGTVQVRVDVRGGLVRVFFDGVQVLVSEDVERTGGSIGLVVNGSTVAFDDIVVSSLDDVLLAESFAGIPNGTLPAGWTSVSGSWAVQNGVLVGSSPSSSDNSRITFAPTVTDYRLEFSMRFASALSGARWAGSLIDTSPGDPLWTMAGIRYNSTAANGVEVTERRSSGWNTLEAAAAPTAAGTSTIAVAVEVRGAHARVFFNGVQVVASANVVRTGGSIGFVVNGSTVEFDDVVVRQIGQVALEQDFSAIANGTLPTGWAVQEGSWQVTSNELIGVSANSTTMSRITFMPALDDYRFEMTMRFVSASSDARWAGVMLDTSSSDPLWTMAGVRRGTSASNGVEVVERRGTSWTTLSAGPAAADAGSSAVRVWVEVRAGSAKVSINGVQVVAGGGVVRSDGSIGLVLNNATVAFDDVRVLRLAPITQASLLRGPSELAYAMAHRGASAEAPENTMPSYAIASNVGSRMIEMDVRRTSDGHYVMFHDASINSKSTGTGSIETRTLAELRTYDFGSWFGSAYTGTPIAEWNQVLDTYKGSGHLLLVELKSGTVKEMLDAVIARGMEDEVIFTSFSRAEMALAYGLAPQVRRAWVQTNYPSSPLVDVEVLGLKMYIIGKAAVLANPTYVNSLRGADVAVTAWTVNDESTWDQLNLLGIDGIVTDEATAYADYLD